MTDAGRSVAAVIVAAGSGERLGAGVPKALVPLRGRPLLDWPLDAFARHPDIDSVVVVAPAAAVDAVCSAVGDLATVVAGGATRQSSVDLGLAALEADVDLVLVHDAARPLVEASVISAVVARLRQGALAVIPVLPVADTVKRVDAAGQVIATVDRADLRAVQTPQGFSRAVLVVAHQTAEQHSPSGVTDDAGLVEALGVAVQTVAGSELGFKITTSYDLRLAERIAPELAEPPELVELSDSGRPA